MSSGTLRVRSITTINRLIVVKLTIGIIMCMNFSFLPYDPIFPKLFAKEKSYLQQIIGKDTVIEHFGSTSV